MSSRSLRVLLIVLWLAWPAGQALAGGLKVHGIFSSNMVLQREKPIVVWGWADKGTSVSVQLGDEKQTTTVSGDDRRWETTFAARPASVTPVTLTVSAGDQTVAMDNLVIGDIWVMWGQSNMAFSLGKTIDADVEVAESDLPLVRELRINPSETQTELPDLNEGAVRAWSVCSPKTAGDYSAIGHAFASRVYRATGIPIGIIDNARGGASIESLLPEHKFDDHPVAARYKAHVEQRIAEFDRQAETEKAWQNAVKKAREKGTPEAKWPKREEFRLNSWAIPGESPSDLASCYNGMFGPFKHLNIKGVLFHQGYNNAISSNCRPRRYRVLMKLMVEGIREDFRDPKLPFGVIGFCATSIPQTEDNFEICSYATAAYIREAQRLGLADVGDPVNTAYLAPEDVQIPGLHPVKKRDHGTRAARWALQNVYGQKIKWARAELVSSQRSGDTMVLSFDKKVMPDNLSMIPQGFSIAGEDGKYYRGYARFPLTKDTGIWNTPDKNADTTKVIVWSPLVAEPVAVRYAWASTPEGNLKVEGQPWSPLHSFRTDTWDFPESDDPAVSFERKAGRDLEAEAQQRLEFRRSGEAKRAVEILERLKTLGKP